MWLRPRALLVLLEIVAVNADGMLNQKEEGDVCENGTPKYESKAEGNEMENDGQEGDSGFSAIQKDMTNARTISKEVEEGKPNDIQAYNASKFEENDWLAVSLPMNVTQEEEEEAFRSLPDKIYTLDEQKKLNKEEEKIGPICGNKVLEDGEECDSDDPCCTKQCKFAPKTVCRKATSLHQAGQKVYLQKVYLRNAQNGRYLLAEGSHVQPHSRGHDGGWLDAPKVRAVDANYHALAEFLLLRSGGYVIIESYKTGRWILGQGSNVEHKYGHEAGWKNAPPVMAADANYYDLCLWNAYRSGSHLYFVNKVTGRYLMGQGSDVHGKNGHEGGWSQAPEVVNSDANYYNLAMWDVFTR